MYALIPITLALFAPTVAAHGGVLSYKINGQTYNGWTPYNSPVGQTTIQRPWATYDPILDPTSSTVSCNDDGNAGTNQLTATGVPAGSTVVAYWNQVWPHAYGPMLTYLAKCPGSSCTSVNSRTLQWFKIDEAGLLSGTAASGKWAAEQMINQNNSWTSTIPASVPSGNYMIRFETIALHSLPAQLYPECAQIEIINGGNREPTAAELVTFPGGYKATDPGLTLDLYGQAAKTMTNYPIPGPPRYGSTSNPTTTVSPQPTTTTTSVPTVAPTSTPTQPAGTVPQYGQCGGIGYTGATGCVAPFKCTKVNDYYYQCLS